MFNTDMTGVEIGKSYTPLPEGSYVLRVHTVEEKKTKAGDPMVKVVLEVMTPLEHKGRKVFHNVTFFPAGAKGAGFAKHWLKVMGQPYEGQVTVNPAAWRGEKIVSDIIVEEDTWQGKQVLRNNLTEIERYDATEPQGTEENAESEAPDSIPF
jgi:hypothetical protein